MTYSDHPAFAELPQVAALLDRRAAEGLIPSADELAAEGLIPSADGRGDEGCSSCGQLDPDGTYHVVDEARAIAECSECFDTPSAPGHREIRTGG